MYRAEPTCIEYHTPQLSHCTPFTPLTTTDTILRRRLPSYFSPSSNPHNRPKEADANLVDPEDRMIAPGVQLGRDGWDRSIKKRADSRTDICLRWSHQSVLVDNTIYIYGGQAKTSADQKTDTWNNNLLTLDLNKDWTIAVPSLKGLPQPSLPPGGPPAVANGYLWHNNDNLYLYGGLFSDKPATSPTAFSLWQYNIKSAQWSDITSETSVANDSGSQEIQRAAEGAGVNVPGRGLGFYFGGHLDAYTTEGWSIETERVYLKSLLEFDMNKNVFSNLTKGGLEDAEVPERADGVLLFVPWGPEGILVSIGGGSNDTFSQLNIIDIYDLSTRRWTKQATDGSTPQYRVNPCAVVGSASDATSHNIYFFGGQNLVPYAEQHQYNDMWILSIPSFTWIQVDTKGQSVPPARAGHTCELHGSEMVVIGGYVGQELSCDSPGIYVFDAHATEWKTDYNSPNTGVGAKKETAEFYRVPQVVINVVGGDATGGATVITPAITVYPDSPIASWRPRDYTYTTITLHTATATATTSPNTTGNHNNQPIGFIIGASLGGIVVLVLLLLGAAYMWYRKEIKEIREASEKIADSTGQNQGMIAELPSGLERSNSVAELMGEPTFWGVLLSPRRSLRVVNH